MDRWITRRIAFLLAAFGVTFASSNAGAQSQPPQAEGGQGRAPASAEAKVQRQKTTKGLPATGQRLRSTHARPFRLDAPDRAALEREIGTPRKGAPLRIGVGRAVPGLDTEAGMGSALDWQQQPDGSLVASVSITSPGAASIRAGVRVQSLPDNAVVRFQSPADETLFEVSGHDINATISRNLASGDKSLEARLYWSPILEGDTVTMEVQLAAGSDPLDVRIAVPVVSHNITSPKSGFAVKTNVSPGGSGVCELDAMCQQSSWGQQMNGVARMSFFDGGYQYACTGTLLADQAGSNTPYFLTANHCIDNQTAASSLSTIWFYRSSTCNAATQDIAARQLTGGAALLYNSTATDTSFMRLNYPPPAGAVFVGWTTGPTLGVGTQITGLHHPLGDWLKYSTGSINTYLNCTAPVNGSFSCNGASPSTSTFYDLNWSQGITEPGSSGSGLFTNDGRLVGQLYGGTGDCTTPGDDIYGRFDVAYYAANGLSQWLALAATQSLSVAKTGTGAGTVTSSPAGISCGGTCSASFTTGSSVTLTAAPAAGSSFAGWSGACTGTGSCTVTMNGAASVTSTFTLTSATLTVTNSGGGVVTSSPAGINCGSTCNASYSLNTMVTLTATPSTGMVFNGWGGACSGTSSTCAVTMSASRTVTASFALPPKAATTLTLASSSNPIAPGRSVRLTATVATAAGTPTGSIGFNLDGASASGCSAVPLSGSSASCTFSGLTVGPHTIFAGYSGDSGYLSSNSASYVQGVSAIPSLDANGDGMADIYWLGSDGSVSLWTMNGVNPIAKGGLLGAAANVQATKVADFNGDGKADLVRQFSDGSIVITLMDGFNPISSATVVPAGTPHKLTAVGDFNGDGMADLLFLNTDGSTEIWLMNGTTVASTGVIMAANIAAGWYVQFVGDFDGDGKSDLIWTNPSGGIGAWTMNGLTATNKQVMFYNGSGWRATHVGDFNGDGKSDVLFMNSTDGSVGMWLMSGAYALSKQAILPANSGITPQLVGDFNGDGKDDILVTQSDGSIAIWVMNGMAVASKTTVMPGGTGWTVGQIADVNGDGRKDLLWTATDGSKGVWLMNGGTALQKSVLISGSAGSGLSYGLTFEQNH